MDGLTRAEQQTAIERIKEWPDEKRRFVSRLRGTELECVVSIAALLDGRPAKPPTRAIVIDLRRKP